MKICILTLGLLICTLGISAQNIKLPELDMKDKSSTVIGDLTKSHSTREFASTQRFYDETVPESLKIIRFKK